MVSVSSCAVREGLGEADRRALGPTKVLPHNRKVDRSCKCLNRQCGGRGPTEVNSWRRLMISVHSRRHHPNRRTLRKRSVAIGRDDLAVGPGPYRPVRLDGDRRLDEVDATVGEQEVGAAGVVAVGVLVLPVSGSYLRGAELAPGECILARGRWYDRVEKGHASDVLRPPKPLFIIDTC